MAAQLRDDQNSAKRRESLDALVDAFFDFFYSLKRSRVAATDLSVYWSINTGKYSVLLGVRAGPLLLLRVCVLDLRQGPATPSPTIRPDTVPGYRRPAAAAHRLLPRSALDLLGPRGMAESKSFGLIKMYGSCAACSRCICCGVAPRRSTAVTSRGSPSVNSSSPPSATSTNTIFRQGNGRWKGRKTVHSAHKLPQREDLPGAVALLPAGPLSRVLLICSSSPQHRRIS